MNHDILSLVDGTRKIILRRPGSDLEIEIDRALLRPFRSRKQSRLEASVVPVQAGHWYLTRDADTPEPRPGDEIDAGEDGSWTVMEVQPSKLNENWQCAARQFAVPFGLDEHVDHLRAAFTKTSAGTLRRGYRVLKTGIAARFSAVTKNLDGDGTESMYVLCRAVPNFEPADALGRHDGSLFEIVKLQKPIHAADWTEIEVRKIH